MLRRLAKGIFLTAALLVADNAASFAVAELPPAPTNIGLPPAPTIVGLPVPTRFRAGVPVRRSDGKIGFIAAPRPAPRPTASSIIASVPLAPLPRLKHASPSRRTIESLVWQLAPQYGLDPNLVVAVIMTESAFRADAVSPKGAQGLMQLIPDTARRFGVENSYDPEQNLRGGMAYLRWLLSYFRGDVELALAAYNAGEGAVERYAGVPPYAETKGYVLKVMRAYSKASHPFDPGLTKASFLIGHGKTGG